VEALTSQGAKKAFIFVNNRFEGNALATIRAMLDGGLSGIESKNGNHK
jgi:hypothetical protein